MSAFLNDSRPELQGSLDSGLGEIAAGQAAYGFADQNNGANVKPIGFSGGEQYDLNLEDDSSVALSTNPLVPDSPHNSSTLTSDREDLLAGIEPGASGETGFNVSAKGILPIQSQSTGGSKTVQAEDYRRGENGVTYFDSTAGNLGGQYRNDAVDIQRTSDVGGGYNVGWIRRGEWLTYDLGLEAGTYDVVIRASSLEQGGRVKLSAGGASGQVEIGKTQGWQKFQNFTIKGLQVKNDADQFRLDAMYGAFNLNYIKFVPSSHSNPSPTPASPTTSSGDPIRIEAEDYGSFYDTTKNNRGGAYRNDAVDIRRDTNSSGGYKVVENRPGEWLQYKFNPGAGTYDIVLRGATNADGGRVKLTAGGQRVFFDLKSTKGLGRNQDFVVRGVELGANVRNFRLDIVSGNVNLDFVEFFSRGVVGGSSPTPPNGGSGENPDNGGNNSGGGNSGGGNSGGGNTGGGNTGGGNTGGGNTGGNTGLGPLPKASYNTTYGYGLVDAAAAVSYAIDSKLADAPNTSSGANSDSLNAINVADVWNAGFTGKGQTVAILDTGVDTQHRDLASNIWVNTGEIAGDGIDNDGNGYVDDVNGYNFTDSSENVFDDNGHGTHLAGIIAGKRNNIGITGVAPDATIMPVKILDADGLGTFGDIELGIRYAVDNGADVINLSLGVDFSENSLRNAIKYAYDKGVVVVSAAGNGGEDRPFFPARYANQYGLAAGSVDSDNLYRSYSNKAGSTTLDYVVAPGHRIISSAPNNGVGTKSGTSQANAHLAGVAALVLSAKPNLAPQRVETLITRTADPDAVTI